MTPFFKSAYLRGQIKGPTNGQGGRPCRQRRGEIDREQRFNTLNGIVGPSTTCGYYLRKFKQVRFEKNEDN